MGLVVKSTIKKVSKVSTTAMVNGVGSKYLKALVYLSEKFKIVYKVLTLKVYFNNTFQASTTLPCLINT